MIFKVVLLGIALTLAARIGAAQTTHPTDGITFPRGTLTLQAYGTYAAGLDANSNLGTGAAGVGYFIFDNLSLGVEANAYRTTRQEHNATAYGISGVLRHHLLHFDRASVFADVSFGPVEATQRVPAGGTYFNFVTRTGIGATYPIGDRLYVLGGVRYFHLSNAHLEGPERNPSINGIEGFVGLMWTP